MQFLKTGIHLFDHSALLEMRKLSVVCDRNHQKNHNFKIEPVVEMSDKIFLDLDLARVYIYSCGCVQYPCEAYLRNPLTATPRALTVAL